MTNQELLEKAESIAGFGDYTSPLDVVALAKEFAKSELERLLEQFNQSSYLPYLEEKFKAAIVKLEE